MKKKREKYHLTVWFPIYQTESLHNVPSQFHSLFSALSFDAISLFPRSKRLVESEDAWHHALGSWTPYEGTEVTFEVKRNQAVGKGRLNLAAPAFAHIVPYSTFEIDFSLAPDYTDSIFNDVIEITQELLVVIDVLQGVGGEVISCNVPPDRQDLTYKRFRASKDLPHPYSLDWITAGDLRISPVAKRFSSVAKVQPSVCLISRGNLVAIALTEDPFSHSNPDHLSILENAEKICGLTNRLS